MCLSRRPDAYVAAQQRESGVSGIGFNNPSSHDARKERTRVKCPTVKSEKFPLCAEECNEVRRNALKSLRMSTFSLRAARGTRGI